MVQGTCYLASPIWLFSGSAYNMGSQDFFLMGALHIWTEAEKSNIDYIWRHWTNDDTLLTVTNKKLTIILHKHMPFKHSFLPALHQLLVNYWLGEKLLTCYLVIIHNCVQRFNPHGVNVTIQDNPFWVITSQIGLVSHYYREQTYRSYTYSISSMRSKHEG
jgi:hypothetical protein